MTTINAAGGDYQGLPTAPIKHRGRAIPEGLPWDRINEDYVAAGGQVDAGVWHQGKVTIVGDKTTRHGIHTFAEGDYQETAAPAPKARHAKRTEPITREPQRTLDPDLRPEVAARYIAGETITGLAQAYNVATGSIQFALKKMQVQTRTPSEAGKLRIAKRLAS